MELSYDSYVDKEGEWRYRKISLMGVVKSFVSQLKLGQDLTKGNILHKNFKYSILLFSKSSSCTFISFFYVRSFWIQRIIIF